MKLQPIPKLYAIIFAVLALFSVGAAIFLGWFIRHKGYLEAAVWIGIPLVLFILAILIVAIIVPFVSREMRQYGYYILCFIALVLLFAGCLAFTLYSLPQQL